MMKKMKKSYFTLLELLIVVAILAIIAGGIVAAYTNIEENAAQAQAARDIAAVDEALQIFSAFESGIPDNVDSLLQYDISGATLADDAASGDTFAPAADLAGVTPRVASAIDNRSITAFTGANANGGLASKVTARFLTTQQIENLQDAGLAKVRFIDANLDDNAGFATTPGDAHVFGTATAPTGDYLIDSMDIPQNYFDAPRSNGGNRGRGFAVDVSGTASDLAADVQFAVWSGQNTGNNDGTTPDGTGLLAPVAKYNNVKLGANPTAVLVAFGLSSNCSLVGKDAKYGLSSGMPYYANVQKNEYNNYIMLVDVQQRPAKVVAVIDSKGDFRAEEYAEYLDQKL
jgi:prepilin-type N-terminal cleavage/methylation domain-containing protein